MVHFSFFTFKFVLKKFISLFVGWKNCDNHFWNTRKFLTGDECTKCIIQPKLFLEVKENVTCEYHIMRDK